MTGSRFIGIRHRVKKTKDNEARPTQVCILVGDDFRRIDLETEQDELDFVHAIYPIAYRAVDPNEDLSAFKAHHLKIDKKTKAITKVPDAYEGLRVGDVVGMTLGGSGNNFAFALSVKAEQVGAQVWRTPPKELPEDREEDLDSVLLAQMVRDRRVPFYEVTAKGRDQIRVAICFRRLEETMAARIATEQRICQRAIGTIFLDDHGGYPQGTLEAAAKSQKANDKILATQIAEEAARERELVKALARHHAYTELLQHVQGIGPRIGARFIVAVGDIRRFTKPIHREEIARLRKEVAAIVETTDYTSYFDKLGDRITNPDDEFRNLQLVRSWCRANNEGAVADLLDEAIAHKKKIHELKLKQHAKGRNAFRKYMGVHVNPDGTFPRRRKGQDNDWLPLGRDAHWQLGDQFNRQPNSVWGKKLRENKPRFRAKHPVPEKVKNASGKEVSRYSDMHIHKMGIWRTLTQFADWLYDAWMRLEHPPRQQVVPTTAPAIAA